MSTRSSRTQKRGWTISSRRAGRWVLTLGILGLLGHWFPCLWLRWVAREMAFRDVAYGFVVVEVRAPCVGFVWVFNGVEDGLQGHQPISCADFAVPVSAGAGEQGLGAASRRPSSASMHKVNGVDEESGVLGSLTVVDYCYSRFALDPRTGLFSSIRCVCRTCVVHEVDGGAGTGGTPLGLDCRPCKMDLLNLLGGSGLCCSGRMRLTLRGSRRRPCSLTKCVCSV
jgi:hypothetical protein